MLNLHKLFKQCLILLGAIITSCLFGAHALQKLLPDEIQRLALSEPGHTYSMVILVSSLALTLFASCQLWCKKSLGRVYLLVSLFGFIVSDYFTAYGVDYYWMGALTNIVYLSLGALIALVYSHPFNQLFKTNSQKDGQFNLATREHLLLLSFTAVIYYIYSLYFGTPAPDIIKNYLQPFELQEKVLSKIFIPALFVYWISSILLNSGIRLVKYLFIASTVMVFIIGDIFVISQAEGGLSAVFNAIAQFITGAVLVVIFCPPLSDFFSSNKSERKIFNQENKDILIEAWVKIKGYFLIYWVSILISASIIASAAGLLYLINYTLQNPVFVDISYGKIYYGVSTFFGLLLLSGLKIQAINHIENRSVKVLQIFSFIRNPHNLLLIAFFYGITEMIPGGFILALLFMFTDTLILEKNMSLFRAMQTSFSIVKNNIFQIAGVGILYKLIAVGLVFVTSFVHTAPWLMLAFLVLLLPFIANLYAILYVKYTTSDCDINFHNSALLHQDTTIRPTVLADVNFDGLNSGIKSTDCDINFHNSALLHQDITIRPTVLADVNFDDLNSGIKSTAMNEM